MYRGFYFFWSVYVFLAKYCLYTMNQFVVSGLHKIESILSLHCSNDILNKNISKKQKTTKETTKPIGLCKYIENRASLRLHP